MRYCRLTIGFAVLALVTGTAAFGKATECMQAITAAAIARSHSLAELFALRAKSDDSYLVNLASVARSFQLNPNDAGTARRLLVLMPRYEPENYPDEASENAIRTKAMLSMGDSQCADESSEDMITLGKLQDALPGLFADAVTLAPEFMSQYILYDMWAVGDPHNDSNVHAQKVCRAYRSAFAKAAANLDVAQREWFSQTVFDIRRCRARLLPESDE